MPLIPFGTAIARKERGWIWLFFSREIPEKLGWKIGDFLILSLNENKDILAQRLSEAAIDELNHNPDSCHEITSLRAHYPDDSKCYIDIPPKIFDSIKPTRGQPFALTGINQNQLLIIKLTLKNQG